VATIARVVNHIDILYCQTRGQRNRNAAIPFDQSLHANLFSDPLASEFLSEIELRRDSQVMAIDSSAL
jgi:hypothetical protein